MLVLCLSLFICTDLHIEKEQAGSAANRHQMACEAFGDGLLPQLQSAVYKVAGQHRLSKRSWISKLLFHCFADTDVNPDAAMFLVNVSSAGNKIQRSHQ